MADVAREAQVSVATVSRLLNGQDRVSSETAERVYAAIEKLAYEPNLLARNLRKNESRVILILAPNVTNPYYAHILAGIGDASADLGYSALIFTTADDLTREREALEMLKKHRADGAILMASNVGCSWLLEYSAHFPIVQSSEYDPEVSIPMFPLTITWQRSKPWNTSLILDTAALPPSAARTSTSPPACGSKVTSTRWKIRHSSTGGVYCLCLTRLFLQKRQGQRQRIAQCSTPSNRHLLHF